MALSKRTQPPPSCVGWFVVWLCTHSHTRTVLHLTHMDTDAPHLLLPVCLRLCACVGLSKSKSQFSKRKSAAAFEKYHRLRFLACSFEIFIGGFNGHPCTKLAKWEIDNMIFEQKRDDLKTMVYSKTQKTLGFPGHCVASRRRQGASSFERKRGFCANIRWDQILRVRLETILSEPVFPLPHGRATERKCPS